MEASPVASTAANPVASHAVRHIVSPTSSPVTSPVASPVTCSAADPKAVSASSPSGSFVLDPLACFIGSQVPSPAAIPIANDLEDALETDSKENISESDMKKSTIVIGCMKTKNRCDMESMPSNGCTECAYGEGQTEYTFKSSFMESISGGNCMESSNRPGSKGSTSGYGCLESIRRKDFMGSASFSDCMESSSGSDCVENSSESCCLEITSGNGFVQSDSESDRVQYASGNDCTERASKSSYKENNPGGSVQKVINRWGKQNRSMMTTEIARYEMTSSTHKADIAREQSLFYLHCNVPLIHHHKGSCNFSIFKVISGVRRRRKQCSTPITYAHLRRFLTKKCIPYFMSKNRYDIVTILLFERIMIPAASYKGGVRLKQHELVAHLLRFCSKHNVDFSMVDIAINSNNMYIAIQLKDVERCVHFMMVLMDQLQFQDSLFEQSLVQYHLGTCFLTIIRNASEHNFSELLQCFRKFGFIAKEIEKEKQSNETFRACLKALREAATKSFSACRDIMLEELQSPRSCRTHSYPLISYFYDTPLEPIYPLLQIADAQLDVPESHNGRMRLVINQPEIELAQDSLTQAVAEYNKAHFPSKRFEGRLSLYQSGLFYRKYQLLFQSLENAMIMSYSNQGDNNDQSPPNIKDLRKLLDSLCHKIKSCVAIFDGSSMADRAVAQDFFNYLSEYCYRHHKMLTVYEQRIKINRKQQPNTKANGTPSSGIDTSQDGGQTF